jgi:hypothetical protein
MRKSLVLLALTLLAGCGQPEMPAPKTETPPAFAGAGSTTPAVEKTTQARAIAGKLKSLPPGTAVTTDGKPVPAVPSMRMPSPGMHSAPQAPIAVPVDSFGRVRAPSMTGPTVPTGQAPSMTLPAPVEAIPAPGDDVPPAPPAPPVRRR